MCRSNMMANGPSVPLDREVLPTNVKPTSYHLTLEPNLETFEYDGEVAISLNVVEDTTSISLNYLELKIASAKITQGSTVVADAPEISTNEDKQIATVSFPTPLKAGSEATLTLKFTGELNDKMSGFYRSSFKDSKGVTKYLATTQMEPTDARRAFPCFDEPALKAKFTVTLIADKHLTCLGNMDIVSEKDIDGKYGNGKKAVTFGETPLMSSYLLAFVVGELNFIQTNAFRLPVRVYAPVGQDIEHGRFSLELASKTLEFYEKAFGAPYPLPKMDMIAIPDFSAGAMENWGLVTYRVVDLLLDEATSSATKKERVAEVVQHELAHQWFGNLVTMDFWDGLWLNEGFATWMSWYSCNAFYPEWKVWQSYVTDNLQSALSLDSLRSSHPIEVPVKRADEITQIFDAISYSKGSCVIRMVSKYLGEDVFMKGIQAYLKKHAFGNTTTADLWAALSEASGKDVQSIMQIWTKEVGHPVVTVTEDAATNSIHVKQNRYLRTNDVKPEEDKTLYPVFLGVRTKDGVSDNLLLTEREASFPLKDLDFFKVNADHSGIYRTWYTQERLAKLGQAARDGHLTVEDRTGLVSDTGNLGQSGHQKTSSLLTLLKEFSKSEKEFVVWNEMIAQITSVHLAWLGDDEVREGLKKFRMDMVQAKAHELGWTFSDADGHTMQQFKPLLFGVAGGLGDETIKNAAFDMFRKFIAGDRAAIHPNLRSKVYSIVLTHGTEADVSASYLLEIC
jgi:aminopeptidase 2